MKRCLWAGVAALAAPVFASGGSIGKPAVVVPVSSAALIISNATSADALGITVGPEISTLSITEDAAQRGLASFITSCPSVRRRIDLSGLTRPEDWGRVCDAAIKWHRVGAKEFFTQQFETVQVGTGAAFATGYYEPELAGSRTRSAAYPVAIYKRPPELVEIDLGAFNEGLKGRRLSGRIAKGTMMPFADRAEIEDGALSGRGLELAWAADPVEYFFLQVQGSGRLRLPDGAIMQLTYAGQNGRTYKSIGSFMRERKLLQPGQYTMQGMKAYFAANPAQARQIMRENQSFVFFAERAEAGALGSLGVVVQAQSSIAADPMFTPLGAPVFLTMDRKDASGLWIAQDTGGAIKGPNRFDTFWGAGAEAARIAGGMSARGTAMVLLPKGTLARVNADGRPTP